MIAETKISYDILNGVLQGQVTGIQTSQKKIKDTVSMYKNTVGISEDLKNSLNCRVEIFKADDIEGGLQFGMSYLYPGTVNHEYFMTKGHFHAKLYRAEFYLCQGSWFW